MQEVVKWEYQTKPNFFSKGQMLSPPAFSKGPWIGKEDIVPKVYGG